MKKLFPALLVASFVGVALVVVTANAAGNGGQSAAIPASPAGGTEADRYGGKFFEKYAFGPLHVKRIQY